MAERIWTWGDVQQARFERDEENARRVDDLVRLGSLTVALTKIREAVTKALDDDHTARMRMGQDSLGRDQEQRKAKVENPPAIPEAALSLARIVLSNPDEEDRTCQGCHSIMGIEFPDEVPTMCGRCSTEAAIAFAKLLLELQDGPKK